MTSYRFGEMELDLDARQLRLRGEPVHLERRPYDLLVLLVTQQGRMVAREEIIAALWPKNVIIDFDAGLNTLVRKVRNALNDSPDKPKFIETVPGSGYRFIAAVTTPVTPDPAIDQPASRKTSRLPLVTLIATAALLLVTVGFVFLQSSPVDSVPTRIAVLPFENMTGNDELRYLASGLAEETSMSLARIDLPNLSVIGGGSAKALANIDIPLRDFGRRFGVDFVVLSSLRLDQSRIRVTSRLLRVADGEQIWSASFDRELTNVLGLQRELSIAIAEQIRQRLSPEVAAAIDRRQTQNPQAYEFYLKGRFAWTQFLPDSMPKALGYYEQAVATDPNYGLAWAGIAHALATSIVTTEANRDAILPASRDALRHALEFSPDLAETQLALASFYFFVNLDLPRAQQAARQAVALDANSAMAHMFLGIVLSQNNQHIEARAMLRRARELDPLFPLMFANSAVVSLQAHEPQEALEFATQAIAINPEFWVGHLHLGSARLALGDYNSALQAYSTAEKLSGGNSTRAVAARAYVLAKLGRIDEARDILEQLVEHANQFNAARYYVAAVYAGLGENDTALAWLNRAMEDRRTPCLMLGNDPMLDTLRSDLRFESLMKRCVFAPEFDSVKQPQFAG